MLGSAPSDEVVRVEVSVECLRVLAEVLHKLSFVEVEYGKDTVSRVLVGAVSLGVMTEAASADECTVLGAVLVVHCLSEELASSELMLHRNVDVEAHELLERRGGETFDTSILDC